AALRRVPAGPFTHLLARDDGGCDPAVAAAEEDADRLAWELLAPAAQVRARAGPGASAGGAARVLADVFGLPPDAAAAYARALFPAAPEDPLVARLRKNRRPASHSPLDGGTGLAEGRDG